MTDPFACVSGNLDRVETFFFDKPLPHEVQLRHIPFM